MLSRHKKTWMHLNCIQLCKWSQAEKAMYHMKSQCYRNSKRIIGQGSMLQSMVSQRVERERATEMKRITGCQEFKVVVGKYRVSEAQRIF